MDLENYLKKIFLQLYLVMAVNWTHCGDHFAAHTNIESLSRIPETNIMLYQLYLN